MGPIPEITAKESVYLHYLALATFILSTSKGSREVFDLPVQNVKASKEIFNPRRPFPLYPLENIPIISLQKAKVMRSC